MNIKYRYTPKELLFCKAYIIDFNGTKAYKEAGYKIKNDNVASVQATRMLSKPKIAHKINELKKDREEKLEVNAEWVLKEAIEIYKIAKGELPHTMSYKTKKVDVHKTNLREACKALEIIGKHTSVKAFEKEVDLGGSTIFAVTMPKEFAQDDDK
jgi:phage terminase small subunit